MLMNDVDSIKHRLAPSKLDNGETLKPIQDRLDKNWDMICMKEAERNKTRQAKMDAETEHEDLKTLDVVDSYFIDGIKIDCDDCTLFEVTKVLQELTKVANANDCDKQFTLHIAQDATIPRKLEDG